jgi:hypothetical protein
VLEDLRQSSAFEICNSYNPRALLCDVLSQCRLHLCASSTNLFALPKGTLDACSSLGLSSAPFNQLSFSQFGVRPAFGFIPGRDLKLLRYAAVRVSIADPTSRAGGAASWVRRCPRWLAHNKAAAATAACGQLCDDARSHTHTPTHTTTGK